MSNYNAATRTNYFRVTDEEKYKELFNHLVSEDDVYDFSKEKDGILYHGFGSYGSIDYISPESDDEDPDYDFDQFLEELQKILPKDEAFIYMESGHEKLRYVNGFALICTKDEIRSVDLSVYVLREAKKMLGNEFETQIEY